MVPVVQVHAADALDLVPFPAGCDLLQVLWCPLEHDGCWVVPEVRRRDSAAVGDVRAAPAVPGEVRHRRIPRPCVVHPELVTECVHRAGDQAGRVLRLVPGPAVAGLPGVRTADGAPADGGELGGGRRVPADVDARRGSGHPVRGLRADAG